MDMKIFITFLILLPGLGTLVAQPEKIKSMQDWDYPYEVHEAALQDSLRIAYIDEGAGPFTLVFVHGLGSYLRAWDQNIEVLRRDFRCIALDLPGYGKSSKGAYEYDMSFFAGAVRQLIDHLELENVILVGHSMGGQIAMHTVLHDPRKIEKLVLLAPAGFEAFSEKESNWLQSVYTSGLIKATPTDQIVKNFELNFYDMPENARFMIDDRMYMRETVEYDRYCEMIPKCVAGMLNEPVVDRLADIALPTLIFFGSADQLIPNRLLHKDLDPGQVAESGHRALPDSKLQMVPEAGHFVQWEQAEWVNREIGAFVKE